MKTRKIISLSLLLGLTFGVLLGSRVEEKYETTLTVTAADSIESYYSSISDSLTGNDLLTALNTLNKSKRKSTVGYAGFKTFASKCDIDPQGSNKIVGFYDNKEVGPAWDSAKTWNREHVWPDSLGGNKVEADAHMVRPTSTAINSERGNKYYGTASGTYDAGMYVANYRGIAARIIFYCAIADTSLKIIDANSGGSNQMGKLSDLLKWNLQYLPGNSTKELRVEQNRNNVIQNDSAGQGNRNPFIDHPEYACRIWGNTNNETKNICSASLKGVTMSKTSVQFEVNSTTTISAKSSNGSAITWTNSNPNAVSLSASTSSSNQDITLSALAVGSATLTATATIEGEEFSATCLVTVKEKAKLSSITLSGSHPTKFKLNSTFTYSGLIVTAKYTSGASKQVTGYTVSSPDMSVVGDQNVTVSYTEESITKQATYKINIYKPEAPKSSGGCGGNIVTTSVILSSLSILGIGLLLIKRKFIK